MTPKWGVRAVPKVGGSSLSPTMDYSKSCFRKEMRPSMGTSKAKMHLMLIDLNFEGCDKIKTNQARIMIN